MINKRFIIGSCLLFSTDALSNPQDVVKQILAFSAATTLSLSPMVSNAVDMSGSYSDPFHPNCQRIIVINDKDFSQVSLKGTDGNPGCPADGSGTPWTLTGKVDDNNIYVDFTPKGGPKDLKGTFDGTGINWPDGNKWTLKVN